MTERGPFDKLFEDAGRRIGGELLKLFTDGTSRESAESAEAKSARSTARREDVEELESLRWKLRAEKLSNREKDAALETTRRRITEHRRTIAALQDELRHLKENTVSPSDLQDDDPYPRFWRRDTRGSTTNFYRVDDSSTVFHKFRQSDEWRLAPSLRESDMPGSPEAPRVRDWDNPDDPQNAAPTLERRERQRRAHEASLRRHPAGRLIGHGTTDDSHDGPLSARLPGNWPWTLRQLVYDVDLNTIHWRDQLVDALMVTVDDWVESSESTRVAHDAIQRVTGASDD